MKVLKICAWVGISLLILFTSACILGNVSITILSTSDIHHHAGGYGPLPDYNPSTTGQDTVLGGYSRLATIINTIRKQQAAYQIPVLLFDSGDFFMGTVYDMTAKDPQGPAALKYFTQMKYDAVTLGNHEFDWSDSGLALLLGNGITNGGFNVPVIASNMTIPTSTPPNPLQSLASSGVIVNKKIIQLPYGVKVGVLGLLGPTADSLAPGAPPVTFDHVYSDIQTLVNNLLNKDCVQVVIALSHGGINNPVPPSTTPTGDDVNLANNVTGINVICSGHYHTATPTAYVVGPSNTIIFEAGAYGEYLCRIDITYNYFLGKIVNYNYTLIPVNDTIQGDAAMQGIVSNYNTDLNYSLTPLLAALLEPFGISLTTPPLTTPISYTSSTLQNYTQPFPPSGTGESGLGDLSADALRNVANSLVPAGGSYYDFSVVENGVIRDGLFPSVTYLPGAITFADVYDALPLGISPDTNQPVPGYPLISFYVTGADLRTICEAGLTLGPPISDDYYLNFSGLNITYNPNLAQYLEDVTNVSVYSPADPLCLSTPTPVDFTNTTKLYHGIVDLYAVELMGGVTAKLTGTPFTIVPRDASGNPIGGGTPTIANYMNYRVLMPVPLGTTPPDYLELKQWIALFEFLGDAFPYPKGDPGVFYGANGAPFGLGERISINPSSPPPKLQ
jgi:5'-nucleotidase